MFLLDYPFRPDTRAVARCDRVAGMQNPDDTVPPHDVSGELIFKHRRAETAQINTEHAYKQEMLSLLREIRNAVVYLADRQKAVEAEKGDSAPP